MTRLRSIVFASVAVLALAFPGARSADSKPDAASGPIPAEQMKDVPWEGLDAEKKAMAVQLFNEQGCDCGCGMKVAGCRRDDSKCGRSLELAKQVVGLVKDGKTKDEILKAAFQPPSKFVQFALEAGDSPAMGPKDAKVTVLHYIDYQCPYCSRIAPTMAQLGEAYPKDVRVVFKMHPLSFHQNAQIAAEAAMAAHAQGKFFEMHDRLFKNQQALTRDNILKWAQEIGLDVPRFTKELDEHAHAARIAKEAKDVEAIGATGTPASFVNGRYVSGAKPLEFFKGLVDEELTWARAGNRPEFKTGSNVKEASAPQPKGSGSSLDPNKVYTLTAGERPSKGPADAPITVLHYFDYQCPVCKRVGPTIDELIAAYPKEVRVVFKMRPLSSHRQGMISAEAAMAAHAQGKFFQMHEKLYENQAALSPEKINAIAQEIGLDMVRFKKELEAHTYKAGIEAEVKEVQAIGSNSTPTTFINGRPLVGSQPLTSFQRVVNEELAKKGVKTAATATPN
ncbi:MAG TPA: thioredoxin domain-containing protein [Candidatus Polarisedimenticolaceae bacterium]|nr:thioredoxin domain-containing protein [Candidatus Polarisedimenticolaceae bacterium]